MRRQDRQISESEAIEILQKGEFGVLSMCTPDSGGYGIPLAAARLRRVVAGQLRFRQSYLYIKSLILGTNKNTLVVSVDTTVKTNIKYVQEKINFNRGLNDLVSYGICSGRKYTYQKQLCNCQIQTGCSYRSFDKRTNL